MLGSASPLWTQAAAEAHVPVTQETGRQAAPIADLRVRVVGSLEEVAPVLAKRQQGCCLPVSLLGVCARRPRGQSKGASETDAATGSQEGPLFAAFFGNPFLLCAVLTFSGQDQRGCPPPPRRRQGFRVPRLWEDAEGSRISPGLGHLSSTPRSLLLQRCAEAQEPGPEGNGLPNARVQRGGQIRSSFTGRLRYPSLRRSRHRSQTHSSVDKHTDSMAPLGPGGARPSPGGTCIQQRGPGALDRLALRPRSPAPPLARPGSC